MHLFVGSLLVLAGLACLRYVWAGVPAFEREPPFLALGVLLIGIGAGLGVLGGTAALLDLLFAGCIATGPCQPVPPVPIVLPVLFLVVGAALILISILHGRSKTG